MHIRYISRRDNTLRLTGKVTAVERGYGRQGGASF
jgi:hypothetical protein